MSERIISKIQYDWPGQTGTAWCSSPPDKDSTVALFLRIDPAVAAIDVSIAGAHGAGYRRRITKDVDEWLVVDMPTQP
jgi:hypothetical protein